MTATPSHGPDETRARTDPISDLDRALIDRLTVNGRESTRAVAAAVGVSETTAAQRMRRLEEQGVMRIVAVADIHALGYRVFAFAWIKTSGRSPLDVAADLAPHPEVMTVSVITGRYDIFVALIARDTAHLVRILDRDLAMVDGVEAIRGDLAVEVYKYESKWGLLSSPASHMPNAPLVRSNKVDELDLRLIRELQQDARQSNRRIAAALSVAEGTVRARIGRLQRDRVIHCQAVSDLRASGLRASAVVGIRTAPGRTSEVAARVAEIPSVAGLYRTLGDFDLIASVSGRNRSALMETILNTIAVIPGVSRTESHEVFHIAKRNHLWARLL